MMGPHCTGVAFSCTGRRDRWFRVLTVLRYLGDSDPCHGLVFVAGARGEIAMGHAPLGRDVGHGDLLDGTTSHVPDTGEDVPGLAPSAPTRN